MTVGEIIRKIRITKKMTQKELGEKCDINEANIRKYESGRQSPKLGTLRRIAEALEVPVTDLIPDDNQDIQNYYYVETVLDKISQQSGIPMYHIDSSEDEHENIHKAIYGSFRKNLLSQMDSLDKKYVHPTSGSSSQADSDVCSEKIDIIMGLCAMLNVEGLNRVISYLTDLTLIPEYHI